MQKQKGLLIVFTGPSGVGKKTVLTELFKNQELKLKYSVSMTTREPRFDEIEGQDYFFVTKERFQQAIINNELLEYAVYVDNFYGTPAGFVNKLRNEGYNVLLEIETQGALQVMNYIQNNQDQNTLTIFLAPPSIEELRKRLFTRNTESIEKIEKRVKAAYKEMEIATQFQYQVVNDLPQHAIDQITAIIKKKINYA